MNENEWINYQTMMLFYETWQSKSKTSTFKRTFNEYFKELPEDLKDKYHLNYEELNDLCDYLGTYIFNQTEYKYKTEDHINEALGWKFIVGFLTYWHNK